MLIYSVLSLMVSTPQNGTSNLASPAILSLPPPSFPTLMPQNGHLPASPPPFLALSIVPGSSPMGQPPSSPHNTGAGRGHGGDQNEAILASTATHHMATPVLPKKPCALIMRPSFPSEDESSDSSDANSKSEDRWTKTQREATREGDWELTNKISSFSIVYKQGRRTTTSASWELIPYKKLKELCKVSKEHGRRCHLFKHYLTPPSLCTHWSPMTLKILSVASFPQLSICCEKGSGKNISKPYQTPTQMIPTDQNLQWTK